MNILDDPVPFSSLDDNYMTIDHDLLLPNETVDECKNANIRFIPNIPIPHIPNKMAIISKHNSEQWLDDLPDNIVIQSIVIHDGTDQNMSCTLANFSTKIWDIKSESVQIDVKYYLTVSDTIKLEDCLTITQSIGESDLFTQHLFNIPRPTPLERYRRNNADQGQRQRILFELNSRNIQELLSSLSNSWQEEQNVLQSMGFSDEEMNMLILSRTMGDINRAVEILLSNQDNGMPNGD